MAVGVLDERGAGMSERARRICGTLEERFWPKVDQSAGPDECWPWTACRTTRGYGLIGVGARSSERSHRVSWMLSHDTDSIPEGLEVCHHCDNPPCVNPRHLFLGTRSANMRDAASKGRHFIQRHPESAKRGSELPWSKLTAADVRAIRAASEAGASYRTLGRTYGVTYSSIAAIVRRSHWKHVA